METRKEDTYISASTENPPGIDDRSLRSKWKTSLHGESDGRPELWYTGITSDEVGRPDTVLPPGHNRMVFKYTPTTFDNGVRFAFLICMARGAFHEVAKPNAKAVDLEAPDSWDTMAVAYIHHTEPGVDIPATCGALVGGPLPLASGRRVWITWGLRPVEPIPPEPMPVGSMLGPLRPNVPGQTPPGLLIKGVHLG